MKVHPSHIAHLDAARSHVSAHSEAESKKSSGVSFAEQLASASTAKSTKKPATPAPATPPKGEKTEAVAGHAGYRDIVAGPRNGMYLNTSGNIRDGQAFVMVKRHGVEYHIYGTGKDRHVIVVRHHSTATKPPAASAPTTTTTTTPTTTTVPGGTAPVSSS